MPENTLRVILNRRHWPQYWHLTTDLSLRQCQSSIYIIYIRLSSSDSLFVHTTLDIAWSLFLLYHFFPSLIPLIFQFKLVDVFITTRVPAGSPSRGGNVEVYVFDINPPSSLTLFLLFCSCVYFCLYGPFNCISFHKFSRQPVSYTHLTLPTRRTV